MNSLSAFVLKVLRKTRGKFFVRNFSRPECIKDPITASKLIFELLIKEEPCMIARFGSTELTCLSNYLGINNENKSIARFIKGEIAPWWWEEKIIYQMQNWSGFFPAEINAIERFCKMMLVDIKEVDVLGSWLEDEKKVDYLLDSKKVHLRLLEPFWSVNPWTKALKGKRVLVIHPFAASIQSQYEKRKLLFINDNVLPDFKSLTVIKAVQSLGNSDERFKDWFEALDFMKRQMDEADYDICLIGAGAYGFHLASHAKRMGKKGIHVGGALQLFFGIRGKRWEDANYGVAVWGIPYGFYPALMNEYWIRPKEDETPKSAQTVEGACYW